jgi:hypothetical protein
MPPKSQLSLKAQIGLCLGVMAFFCVALAIGGYMGSHQTSAKMEAFASDGATAKGTITRKYIHSVARTWVYWLDVRFKSQDGAVHNLSANVANTIFDSLDEGGPVEVTYVRSNPQWFYVAGDAPTERDVGISNTMFQVGIYAGLLCLAGLFSLWMWDRGGGTPPQRVQAAQTQTPAPRMPSGPRTTFGVRRS